MRYWYRTFFDEVALDVWQSSRTLELTAAEATYLTRELGIEAPARVLDLACGNGRHAALLAAAGYQLTGVDITEGNRERVAENAKSQGVEIDFVVGDMSALELEGTFDAAYSWGNSLGYFPREGMRAFFSGCARALRSGARLVLDTATAAETILCDLDRRTWFDIDPDMRVMLASSYDVKESRLDTVYTTIKDKQIVDESTAHVWLFTSGELVAMADEAGFVTVHLHGDLDSSPFELGDEQLILVLEKR